MSIVRLYNCPYFINGECSLRSHDDPLIDFWNSKYIAEAIIPHCPKGREYCHVGVDTDNWSGDTLKLIRTIINGYRRNGNSNTGEIVDIIEQILERQDDMKDYSSLESLLVSRKWSEKKQAEARQEGREEAWDLAQRVNLLPEVKEGAYGIDELGEAFGACDWSKVLLMPVEELLAKDKKYQEEKKALHVGDEVEFGVRAIVSKKYRGYITDFVSPNTVRVLTKELGTIRVEFKECKKTGKHNPYIEKVMASFEEEKE